MKKAFILPLLLAALLCGCGAERAGYADALSGLSAEAPSEIQVRFNGQDYTITDAETTAEVAGQLGGLELKNRLRGELAPGQAYMLLSVEYGGEELCLTLPELSINDGGCYLTVGGDELAEYISAELASNALTEAKLGELAAAETYPDNSTGELAVIYTNLDELKADADVIALVSVVKSETSSSDVGFRFCKTELKIKECVKGELKGGERIEVAEAGGTNGMVAGGIPLLDKDSEYVLFLLDDGGYYICGAFQGRFIVKEGYVFQQATEEVKLPDYKPTELSDFLDAVS